MDHAATTTEHHTNYFLIWLVLMGILVISLCTGVMPVSKTGVEIILFTAAAAKAWMVIRNFMHLKRVTPWLYAIMLVPLAFAIMMVIVFIPDIGLYVWRGPKAPPPVVAGAHGAGEAHAGH